VEEGPKNPTHAITLELVDIALRATFGTGWRIRGQSPLVLGHDIGPEPDCAVLAGSPRASSGHPTTADLVVEVADASLNFDTNDKRRLDARPGIGEYWVVDIDGRRLLVYREPQTGDYASPPALGPAAAIAPLALLSAVVRIADLLP
jgi:Uma2 family endonuclease